MTRQPRPMIGVAKDVLLAVLAFVLITVATFIIAGPPGPVGTPLLALATGALAVRRRWPIAVMGFVIAVSLTYALLGLPGAVYSVAIGLAIYTVSSRGHRRAAVLAVLGSFAAFIGVDLVTENGHSFIGPGALWFLGWMTAALSLGEVSRSRAEYLASVEQRAREAEQTREEEARRRAGEERMRIARDLHDVLAHSISIINVQAGAASHHLDSDPDKARDALDTVRRTGKEALRELRSSLGVLRSDGGEGGAPRAPSPGMGDIAHLLESVRTSGLDVQFRSEGEVESVPPDVGLAAYRVIQESLTNITRHAAANTATVTVEWRPDELRLRVDDDGVGGLAPFSDGHGITGMRERLMALGGSLRVGPQPGRGFHVEARIPLGQP